MIEPMSTPRRIRVLVVEDHTVVRKALVSLLDTPRFGIEVVGEAADGVEAVTAARALSPDVILMDLLMPRKDGIEAIREIRMGDAGARILVLTSFQEPGLVSSALRSGAMGYLLKEASPDEVIEGIRAVYGGKLHLPIDLARQVVMSGESPPDDPADVLTTRELDVLRAVGQGLTNQEIADQMCISQYTVRAHVRSILGRLGLANRTQAAVRAIEAGLVPRTGGGQAPGAVGAAGRRSGRALRPGDGAAGRRRRSAPASG